MVTQPVIQTPGDMSLRYLTVGFGSVASFERCRHVGFTPDSGRYDCEQRTDALGQKATFPQVIPE
jgi:hypothetical protein